MRKARFISPTAEEAPAIYHIHSRCVDRVFKLAGVEVTPDGRSLVAGDDGGQARSVFVRILHDYAEFLGCRVNAFCVMSNHFHILLEVPAKKKGEAVEMSDEAFLSKIERMYAVEYFRDVQQMLERFREGGFDGDAEALKSKYTRRMYDLSEFMKGVKQRFSQWYNREHRRTGTLWEGRFKSVLVEGGFAARIVAAYIDLNPVRAGIVDRPEDYRWSSYGVAMRSALGATLTRGGKKSAELRDWARAGLCRVMALRRKSSSEQGVLPEDFSVMWDGEVRISRDGSSGAGGDGKADHAAGRSSEGRLVNGAEWYRMMLYADGEEVFTARPACGVEKERVRKGFKREEVQKVLARGGKLSVGEALRCRLRYLTDGLVFGRRCFVNEVFEKVREYFGKKRKSGARPIREIRDTRDADGRKSKDGRLCSMRALRKDALE